MAVLTTDTCFSEGGIPEHTITFCDRLWEAAVACYTSRQDWAPKPVVLRLIAGREFPGPSCGIEGQRRLKQVVASPHNKGEADFASSDNVLKLFSMVEDFFSVRVKTVLTLINVVSLTENLEVSIQLSFEYRSGS
jgi:hypothetical protein